MIADTSLSAYSSLKKRGALTAGQKRIMLWMFMQPNGSRFTRAEIAQKMGIPLQSCCGRTNELLKLGYLRELPSVRCPVTGNPAHQLQVTGENCGLPASSNPPLQSNAVVAHPSTAQPALQSATEDSALLPAEPSGAVAVPEFIHLNAKRYEVVFEGVSEYDGTRYCSVRPI